MGLDEMGGQGLFDGTQFHQGIVPAPPVPAPQLGQGMGDYLAQMVRAAQHPDFGRHVERQDDFPQRPDPRNFA
jgi:hypothetical protein